MTLLQYASFNVFSDAYTPDQMTDRLGLNPSRVAVRASRQTDAPAIPRTNIWSFRATGTAQADELVRQLLDRFEPLGSKLALLTEDGAAVLSVSLVRYFDTPDESAETLRRDDGRRFDGVGIEGFHLDVSLLRRLADLDCALDVDEYDGYAVE